MIEPYEIFLEVANIAEWNTERRAFFYIIGNNEELLNISEKINLNKQEKEKTVFP